MRHRRFGLRAILALVCAGTASFVSAAPAPGRYGAELCVTSAPAAQAGCGPVQADVRGDGSVRLRIDDIVYRLQLHSSQVEVVLMHGAMQIDEFTVPYEWVGRTLQFSDEGRARYEVRFPPRRIKEQ